MELRLDLEHRKTQVIVTDGRYQIYHLIKDLLALTGPAGLFISSYSVNEEFLRFILRQRSSGVVKHLTILLDFKAISKGLHLAKFAGEVADRVYLGSNHTKIILLDNAQWKISVITSQNLTRGNRIESCMISRDPSIFTQLDYEMREIFKSSIPVNDVFKRATGENPGVGRLSDET